MDCYRSFAHRECSDGFYQQQAKEKTEQLKIRDEEKKKMEATLEKYGFRAPENGGPLEFSGEVLSTNDGIDDTEIGRFEEASTSDDDDEESEQGLEEDEETVRRRKDLELRFAGLNIEEADFEEIWGRLDSREREEFVRLAQELEKEESHIQGLAE